jgi:hypothetical protein
MKVSSLRNLFESKPSQDTTPIRGNSFNRSPTSSFVKRVSQPEIVLLPKSPRKDTFVLTIQDLSKDIGYIIHDFHAEAPDEITVSCGDVVKLVIREPDWTWCQVNGVEGNIPTTHYTTEKPQEKPVFPIIQRVLNGEVNSTSNLPPIQILPSTPTLEKDIVLPERGIGCVPNKSLIVPRKSPKLKESMIHKPSILTKMQEVKIEPIVITAPMEEKELPTVPSPICDAPSEVTDIEDMVTTLSVIVPDSLPRDSPRDIERDHSTITDLRLRIALLESEIFGLLTPEQYMDRLEMQKTKDRVRNQMEIVKKQLVSLHSEKSTRKQRFRTILLETPSFWKNSNGIHWTLPNSKEFEAILPIFKGNFLIESINRIENSKIYSRYKSRVEHLHTKVNLVPKVDLEIARASNVEYYMLYYSGSMMEVASNGFDGKSKVNGPLGCGFYLFDSIQGISEMIAKSKMEVPSNESMSILVCRVSLGAIRSCQNYDPKIQGFDASEWSNIPMYVPPKSRYSSWCEYGGDIPGTTDTFDSIVIQGNYTEVVVFHPDQIYPEFLVEGHILRE